MAATSPPRTSASNTRVPNARIHKRRRLTPQQIREVAAKAYCHTGTVVRFLDGEAQWSTSAARITAAMKELGFT